MKDRRESKIRKILDVVLCSVVLVTIEYILLCCSVSLKENVVSAYISGIGVFISANYYIRLKSLFSHRIWSVFFAVTALILLYVLVILIVYYIGYLDVSFVHNRIR